MSFRKCVYEKFFVELVEKLKSDSTIQIEERKITFKGNIPQHLRYLPAVQFAMNTDGPSSFVTVTYTQVPDSPICEFFFL